MKEDTQSDPHDSSHSDGDNSALLDRENFEILHCFVCLKIDGELLPLCKNCLRNVFVHIECAEKAADDDGRIHCSDDCPAVYDILYFANTSDIITARKGASVIQCCPPSRKNSTLQNVVVMKPCLLLILCSVMLGAFLETVSNHDKMKTASEVTHIVAVSSLIIAWFLFEADMESYIALYRNVRAVRREMLAEFLLLLTVLAVSLAAVKIIGNILHIDPIFGGWIAATNLILLPVICLQLMYTRLRIYKTSLSIRVQFSRVFEA